MTFAITFRALRALGAAILITFAAAPAHADDSLYKDLGERAGIQKFTKDFVGIITTDPRISGFFKTTDLQRLELMLSEQFCQLAGGPCKYSGRTMSDAHKGMGVANKDFNALAEDLQIAMERAGVSSRASNKLVALLAPMQRDISSK